MDYEWYPACYLLGVSRYRRLEAFAANFEQGGASFYNFRTGRSFTGIAASAAPEPGTSSIEATLDSMTGDTPDQLATLGTESQYWMNSSHSTVAQSSPNIRTDEFERKNQYEL
jgi:hypothetical protein